MKRLLLATTLALPLLGLSACLEEGSSQPSNRQVQERAATSAANSVQFNANAEIDNIKRRLMLTADPTLLGYIVLMNEAGQPIIYEGVRGKVSTSGSRLTAPDRISVKPGGSSADSQAVVRAPSDTGTYDTGTAQFIFYWTTSGQYRQWSGPYLYSDKPIRLRVEPLVINTTGVPE